MYKFVTVPANVHNATYKIVPGVSLGCVNFVRIVERAADFINQFLVLTNVVSDVFVDFQ